MVVGAVIVDMLALRALQAEVINVRSDFYLEQSSLSARARCNDDWLGVALHSWNAANAGLQPQWYAFQVHDENRSLAEPVLGGVVLGLFGRAVKTTEGGRVGDGLDRGEFARALEHLGRPEAEAEWQRAAKRSGLSVARLKKLNAHGDLCADAKYRKTLDAFLERYGHPRTERAP